MTVITHGNFADATGALAIESFTGMYEGTPDEWTQVFDVEQAKKRREEYEQVFYDFDVAQEKPSGTPFHFDEAGALEKKQYEFKEFGIAFSITRAAREDGDHISIINRLSKSCARAMKEAKEIFHANILNRSFTAAFPGADGVELCDAAHPVYGGATQSNIATTAQLSEASLEAMCTSVHTAKNRRNTGYINLKVKQLVVPPNLIYAATRILRSELRPGTANNDTNALRLMGVIPRIVVMRRLTSTTAFWLQTDVMDGLKHKVRWPIKYATEPDFQTSNLMYKWEERYDAGWTDFLTVYGNIGAAA